MHGAILPGISSGVLMVSFGMYEKLVDSLLNFFKDIKKNAKLLFPIILGGCIGIILFGNLLKMLLSNYEVETKFLFIGLILGGIPTLLKTANSKKGFRLHYAIYSIISFSITIVLICLENTIRYNNIISMNFLYLTFAGFIMSIGVVVPGISSTVLLMILGVYNIYLMAVSEINLYILLPMGLGLIIGGYIFLKLIKYCLDNFHIQTYYSIIGFVLGSIIILYPGLQFNTSGLISLICFSVGLYVSKISEMSH